MSDDLRLKIERVLEEHVLSTGRAAQLARIIIDSEVLAEHDAAIWAQGFKAGCGYSKDRSVGWNPYRQQPMHDGAAE